MLPQGIAGWTVAAAGLLLIALRAYGAWRPRTWAEWTERQFVHAWELRVLGALLLAAALILAILAEFPQGLLRWIFPVVIAATGLLGTGLLLLQNHVRHLVLATAEGSDAGIRVGSVLVILLGLLMIALAVF